MKKYIMAYDLGTSGVKGAVVDFEGGVVATATEGYPLYTPAPGYAEQDGELYWQAVCKVTVAVLAKSGVAAEEIAGMAFGTLWKGIIPVDKQGRVLHPNGLSLAVDNIAKESPTFAELGAAANYSLKFNHKNVKMGMIKSNG